MDGYGFPDAAVANGILTQMTDFGESRESLETTWETWMHHLPFDTAVGSALPGLYHSRLSRLDPERDKTLHQSLARKQTLLQDRIKRYRRAERLEQEG